MNLAERIADLMPVTTKTWKEMKESVPIERHYGTYNKWNVFLSIRHHRSYFEIYPDRIALLTDCIKSLGCNEVAVDIKDDTIWIYGLGIFSEVVRNKARLMRKDDEISNSISVYLNQDPNIGNKWDQYPLWKVIRDIEYPWNPLNYLKIRKVF